MKQTTLQTHTGLTLRRQAQPEARGFFASLLPLLPFLAGLSLTAAALFPSILLPFYAVFALLFVLSGAIFCAYRTRIGGFVLPLGCVLLALAALLLRGPVMAGGGVLLNDLSAHLSAATGTICLTYAADGSPLAAAGLLLLLAALLAARAAADGNALPLLPILLPALAAAFVGVLQPGAGLALLLLGALLPGMARGASLRMLASRLCCLLLAAAVAAGGWALLRKLPAETWSASLRARIHAARYDDGDNAMPEGILENLGPFRKSGAEALAVTMETPQKLYLRGAVYETYTGTAWEARSTKDRAEYSDLFYWLHESGFYGQSQLALAAAETGEPETAAMTVQNLGACSAHAYVPYGLSGSAGLDADLIGDAAAPASLTEMTVVPGGLADWYAAQQALAEAQDDAALADYRAAEEAYADYLKDADLQMTEESWNVVRRQLGTEETPRTLSEIRALIRDYLTEHMTYEENIYTMSGSGDFLHYVLERSGKGYSVHYATAAVLMLRYCGVPARYVEGYFLSADDAAALAAGETVTLTEENAHAWAEYYLSGVGFVPFEVTPGYIDDEELNAGGGDGTDGAEYQQTPQEYRRTAAPEQSAQQEKNGSSFAPMDLLRIFGILLLLLLLALLLRMLLRRRALRRQLAALDAASPRDAILGRYAYAFRLLAHAPDAAPEGAAEAAAINREAMFSNHAMTEAQRDTVVRFSEAAQQSCLKSWSLPERLRYRYRKCICL